MGFSYAAKLGFEHERYERLRSGLLYTLNRLADDGHCYATREMLTKTGAELLTVDAPKLSGTLDDDSGRRCENRRGRHLSAAILPQYHDFRHMATAISKPMRKRAALFLSAH